MFYAFKNSGVTTIDNEYGYFTTDSSSRVRIMMQSLKTSHLRRIVLSDRQARKSFFKLVHTIPNLQYLNRWFIMDTHDHDSFPKVFAVFLSKRVQI